MERVEHVRVSLNGSQYELSYTPDHEDLIVTDKETYRCFDITNLKQAEELSKLLEVFLREKLSG